MKTLSSVSKGCAIAASMLLTTSGTYPVNAQLRSNEDSSGHMRGLNEPKERGPRPVISSAPDTHIIRGDYAENGDFPYYAKLLKNASFQCGAQLIHPKFLLTAAHCVMDEDGNVDPAIYKAQVGALCSYDETNCGQNMTEVSIRKIIVHPEWNPDIINNDYAVLKLKERVTNIAPVKLDDGTVSADYTSDKRLMIAGFGITEIGDVSTHLKKAEMNYVRQDRCEEAADTFFGGYFSITENMMCVHDFGQSACNGDSGGPLIDMGNDEPVLVGLTSWGLQGCEQNFPSVYARVSIKYPWITETICDNTNDQPDYCTKPETPTTCDEEVSLNVYLSVTLDEYPAETSWGIFNNSTETMEYSEKYTSSDGYHTFEHFFCLECGRYTYQLFDEYGDGGANTTLVVNGVETTNEVYTYYYEKSFGEECPKDESFQIVSKWLVEGRSRLCVQPATTKPTSRIVASPCSADELQFWTVDEYGQLHNVGLKEKCMRRKGSTKALRLNSCTADSVDSVTSFAYDAFLSTLYLRKNGKEVLRVGGKKDVLSIAKYVDSAEGDVKYKQTWEIEYKE